MRYRVISDRLPFPQDSIIDESDMDSVQLARLAAGGHLQPLGAKDDGIITSAPSPADASDLPGSDDHRDASAEDEPDLDEQ